MKKQLILTSLAFLVCFLTKGQSLLTNNSTWTIQKTTLSVQSPGKTLTYETFLLKDSTTINGTSYNNLYSDTLQNLDPVGFLRSSGKQIYFRYNDSNYFDTTEFLLYDFAMNIGDTISLRFDDHWSTPADVQFWRYQLVSTDSVNTVSGLHSRMKLFNIDPDTAFSGTGGLSYHECYGDTLEWIEDIGCPTSILYPFHAVNCMGFGVSWHYEVTCHHKDNILSYQPKGACTFLGDEEYALEIDIQLFPSPTSGTLNIKTPFNIHHLEVFDLNGSNLLYQSSDYSKIDVSSLKSGLYILSITAADKSSFHKKFIKE